jgi:hypothetical protein
MRLAGWAVVLLLAGQNGPSSSNPDYRCQLVFTRIRYGDAAGAASYFGGGSAWSHDYPRADLHLSRLLSELTNIDANTASTNVFTLDDPELYRHPISYLSEPGFWTMNDEEAKRLRSYLLKGGFLIFDDFEQEQWYNFEEQMMRVLPEHRLVEIKVDHPIFNSFFEMKTIDFPHPLVAVWPTYYGIFEDNDPSKRLMVIVNYNNDIAEYWEWSDQGWFPIDITNEAYKLGVNYMIYALTH